MEALVEGESEDTVEEESEAMEVNLKVMEAQAERESEVTVEEESEAMEVEEECMILEMKDNLMG